MQPRAFYFLMMMLVITLAATGCSSTKNITLRSEIAWSEDTGPVTVFTKDSVTYKLTSYMLAESTLSGNGSRNEKDKWVDFKGDIGLNNIAYIHAKEFDFLKTVILMGGVAAVGTMAILNLDSDHLNTLTEDIRYHSPYHSSGGGSTSCPYVYSWTGERYLLEAEAFGIAFGKSLELTTSHRLPSLKPENGSVKIKIANRRPETHYINELRLFSVEVPENSEIFLDEKDQAWPVYLPHTPAAASDNSGGKILSEVSDTDGNYWESRNLGGSPGSEFEDVVELSFVNDHSEGSLLITGINSEFSQVVFKNVFDFMGDNSLSFMHAVEHDPEMADALRYWIDESSLKVSLWTGAGFRQVGKLHAEATAVPFSRIVRIDARGIPGDTLKIRLSCLTDLWKIDRVRLDWTPAKPLPGKELALVSALRENNTDVSANISDADDKYEILIPPESVELTYRCGASSGNDKTAYVLKASGYLHEWLPPASQESLPAFATSIPYSMKVGYIKNLIRHKELFLPPIYSEWYRTRGHAN